MSEEKYFKNTEKSETRVVSKPLQGRVNSVLNSFSESLGNEPIYFSQFDDSNILAATEKITGDSNMPKFDIANSDLLINFGLDFFNSNHSYSKPPYKKSRPLSATDHILAKTVVF